MKYIFLLGGQKMEDKTLSNLLNHLNIISITASRENAVETQKLIKKTIENIRYKTARKGQILTVKEELRAVSNLIDLYSLRFGDVFNYSTNIDAKFENIYVPHYSIMAFIENGITHAFEEKEGLRELKLSIKEREGFIRILVSDNGQGFDYEGTKPDSAAPKKYGSIADTQQRLREYYGCNNTIEIKSQKNKGTDILMLIPWQGEEHQV